MSRKTTAITFAVTVLILSSCYTLQVNKIEANKDAQNDKSLQENGVIYALPKKEFQLEITVEQTTSEPSPLVKADPQYKLAIKPIEWQLDLKVDTTTYKITDVKLLERSVPDSANIYFVSLLGDRAPFLKASHSFSFASGIFLTESKNATEDQTGEFIAEALPFVLKTAAKVIFPVGGIASGLSGSLGSLENYMMEDSLGNQKGKLENRTKSITKQLVERILTLQKERMKILSGTASNAIYEHEQTALILLEIDKELATLISLIEGKKTIKTTKTVQSFDPCDLTKPIFYFSKERGIASTGSDSTAVSVLIPKNPLTKQVTNFFAKKDEIIERKGIYYRIPYTTELVVRWKNKDLLRSEVTIPQLGSVGFLPSKIAVRSNDIQYTLDEKTGALITFKANGEGISLESTQKVLDAASQLPEDKIKRLENEIKLKELQEKLDSLNGTIR